ncbi:MAG: FecR domain-containing protein [Deltaproteobacteria bacterium]|nr:FecR domain-containing protein [Deltaproteobacteria bacterium]
MTTTPCERLKTQLASAPETASALPRALTEHAAQCPPCAAEVARALALVSALEDLGKGYAPPADLVDQALARAASPTIAGVAVPATSSASTTRKPWGFIASGLVGAAAAAAVAIAVSGPSTGGPTKEPVTGEPARPARLGVESENRAAGLAPDADEGLAVRACLDATGEVSCDVGLTLTTAIGETRAFRLTDGTLLHVDQDTTIVFDRDARALKVERGEAFLDVAKRPDLAALRVTLPTGDVDVLGTQIEVRAGQALSVVDVVRGVVAVEGAGAEKRVRAGQAAWMAAGKAPVVRASAGTSGPEGWSAKHDASAPGYTNVGFGSIRARRPGATADADTPLALVDHLVTTRIQGMMAKTTVEESFRSEEGHELEGTYRFTLPAGAQVAELSLLVGDVWEEGAFVARDRADKIWAGVIRNATPIVKRREIVEYIWVPGPWKDPALLSWKQGNTFELRIFPIPARGERRVRIAYTERLPLVTGGRRYTLPLPSDKNAARAERFALDLQIGGLDDTSSRDVRVRNYELARESTASGLRLATERRGFRPTGDLVVEIPDADAVSELTGVGFLPGNADDGYVAFTLRPDFADAGAEPSPIEVALVVDTSYGIQKLRLERAADLARELVRGLGKDDRVQVLACATRCQAIIKGESASAELADRIRTRLARLEPMGTSRLGHAFSQARDALGAAATDGRGRIVYLGDGVASTGELDAFRLASEVRAAVGDLRVTAVALGGETDDVFLSALTRAHAGSFLDVAAIGSVEATARKVLARQHGEPLRDARLTLPEGVERVAPASLGDLWPGEERVVTGRVRRGADVLAEPVLEGEVKLTGTLAGEAVDRSWTMSVPLGGRAGNAFVPRLWAEARIAELSQKDDAQTVADIVAISETHHVMSRHTSLLVLESPAMAKAFGVEAKRGVAEWSGEDQQISEVATATGGTLEAAGVGKTGALADGDDNGFGADAPMDALGPMRAAEAAPQGSGGLANQEPKLVERPASTTAMPAEDPFFGDDRRGRRGAGGEWVAMKKVWYKEAAVRDHAGETAWEARQLEQREARWDEEPNSRERTLALVRWHLRMGRLDEAERLTQRWLERDRMDPEALVTLADIAARKGDMPRAEGWLASAVDADHRSAPLHARLADLYGALGEDRLACEHRLARALVARNDAQAQVDAVRCGASRERVLDALDDAIRTKAERALDRDATATRLSGPFEITATWGPAEGADGAEADLDLVVVSPSGRVVSRMGGAVGTGTTLVVSDATSTERERLTFKGAENGRWQVFVVRRADAVGADAPERIEGTVRVTAHGTTRRMAFVIGAEEVAAPVADIDVQSKFRYERAE